MKVLIEADEFYPFCSMARWDESTATKREPVEIPDELAERFMQVAEEFEQLNDRIFHLLLLALKQGSRA